MSEAVDEAIKKTISAIENVAPKAWAMLVQQQRIAAIESIITIVYYAAFFIMAIIIINISLNKRIKKISRDVSMVNDGDINSSKYIDLRYTTEVIENYTVTKYIITMVLSTLVVFIISFGIDDILQFNYPDIYAAKMLIDKVR